DLSNVDTAMNRFERAVQLDPNSALPYAGLAQSQWEKSRRTSAATWKERARDSAEKARARNPDAAPVHIALGMLDLTDGAADRAAEDFQRALDLEPRNADAHRLLAQVYESMNRLDEALAEYKEGTAAEPTYYKPWLNLGVFHYNSGRYEDAVAAFQIVTK